MDLSPYQPDSDEFAHLSLRDLLSAREQYHVYLMRHPNVVATALGRYRIRKGDSWPTKDGPGPVHQKGPRYIENSEVRPYSWPAILVFVERWVSEEEFGADSGKSQLVRSGGRPTRSNDMVPPFLFLPDGRRVPVCVIVAPSQRQAPPPGPLPPYYPLDNIGGGYPVYARVQGREHIATIACLVSDGHKIYALTNRHVVGAAGEVLWSMLDGEEVPIGRAAVAQLKSVEFSRMYPGLPDANLLVNLDVGLIELDDVTQCSAKIAGIGEMGPMADFSAQSISLSLVGCLVCGYGVGSGLMRGEIHALFYRYKSQGGFEYVSDLMIGPRTSPAQGTPDYVSVPDFATHPGDSGTLWLLEPFRPDENGKMPLPLPLAVQWGQSTLVTGADAKVQTYALATLLSRVCSILEVDPIRDLNKDRPETWGDVGHFSIASRIANALSSNVPKLAELMKNNLEIISHKDARIKKGDFGAMSKAPFVPMADVPDFVWKHGTQGFKRGAEGPNHFADMDQPRNDKKTLLVLSKDKKFFDPEKWDAFYEQLKDADTGGEITWQHRGLLPFRVWQIFDEMVDFATAGQIDEFVCAAGVLAHYVGDSCQPLHISFKFDGDPFKSGPSGHKLGEHVHDAYESKMVAAMVDKILTGLDGTPKVANAELVKTGREAGLKTLALMTATFAELPPDFIIDVFANPGTETPVEALVKKCGDKTIAVMKDGVHLLAVLWESAWVEGKGEGKVASTTSLTPKRAMSIISPKEFLQSYSIGKIGEHLKGKPG